MAITIVSYGVLRRYYRNTRCWPNDRLSNNTDSLIEHRCESRGIYRTFVGEPVAPVNLCEEKPGRSLDERTNFSGLRQFDLDLKENHSKL